MFSITVSTDESFSAFPDAVALSQRQIHTAATRAANKTARWARATIARDVAGELDIKVGLVRNSLSITRASRAESAAILSLGKRQGVIPSIDLGEAKQNTTGTRVARRQYDHAFIATMKSGHRGIYRVDKKRAAQRKNRKWGDPQLPIVEYRVVLTGRIASALEDMQNGNGIRHYRKLFERELRHLRRR